MHPLSRKRDSESNCNISKLDTARADIKYRATTPDAVKGEWDFA